MIRTWPAAVLAALLAGAGGGHASEPSGGAAAGPPGGPVTYTAPVHPVHVVRGFDPPVTPYGPGHLGVDLAVPRRGVVRSAGAGVVTFAGPVAGRGVVVVQHRDGVSTEYEPVRASVSAGDAVVAGTRLGVVRGAHGSCAPGRCLHWGAKRAGLYLDPMGLLRPLGPVRLLPWPGDP